MFNHTDAQFEEEFIARVDVILREKASIGPADIKEVILDIEPIFAVLQEEMMNKVVIGMWNGYVDTVLHEPDLHWDDGETPPVEIPPGRLH